MIPQETVDIILDTARIDDVVSDFVALKRRGANFVACCPFHNEKTPSFYVSPAKGIYKCFGCGKAGTAVGFVMEHEKMSYSDALRYLARKYNIDIVEEQESAEQIALRQRRESLLQVMEFASRFFTESLTTAEGRSNGYSYFRSRGLEDATIARFGLGWAPRGRTALLDAATAAGYKTEYLIEAGLCMQHDDGSVTDRFHDRVAFPIHSVSGRIIGFSCRTLSSDGSIAKYVNSPDTPLYDKSSSLYGIYLAKSDIVRLDSCFLVEGNVDVVTMHQLGLTNTVASCGTALTAEQVRLIHKFTPNVTLMYDGDAAGIHAALKAINLILSEGMNVKLVLFPEGEDPDSYCRKHTLAEVQSFIAGAAVDFVTFMKQTAGDAATDPIKRAGLINSVADNIASIPDAVGRSVFVDTCATAFGVDPAIIFSRINATRSERREEQYRAEVRERRRERNIPGYEARLPKQESSAEVQIPIENKTLARAERDLVYFLLNFGMDRLDFPSDSDYYVEQEELRPTVADFIRAAIDGDGTSLANSVYRRIYETFSGLYDAGASLPTITAHLMNSDDRTVAETTGQLITEKYQLTVRNFEAALTAKDSWLVTFVPKSILCYQERRMQDRINYLRAMLANPDVADKEAIMKDIVALQSAQQNVKHQIGRDKK